MGPAAQSDNVIRFESFELNPKTGELRKGGVRLNLQDQPFKVLVALLQRPGEMVTREDLRQLIWPEESFGDFDHAINRSIAKLRSVLGDSSEVPHLIETLPRRGYRFIAPIEPIPPMPAVTAATSSGTPQAQPTPSPETDVQPRHGKRSVWILAAVLLLGLLVAANVGDFRQRLFGPQARTPIQSIAVLPLNNLSGDPSQEFFVDGMTDQLITDLAQVGSLRVISRTSVMQYKGTKKSLPEIARELRVDAIVEGSVIRSGQRVRVTAQLLQAPTDQHLWAKTYDRDLGDVLKLQGEVADAIAQQVRAQLTPTQEAHLRRDYALNPEAYDAYLKGRVYYSEYANGFPPQPDSLKKAQHYFEESIQKDPNFALAYAGLADTDLMLWYAGVLQKDEAYRSVKEESAKALQLDNTIGEAHLMLATLSSDFDWDWEDADREYKRAIAMAPSYNCAHESRAIFLSRLGRRAEALAELEKSNWLDYSFWLSWAEQLTYYNLRDFPSLIAASRRGLLLNPKVGIQHYFLGVGYEGTGKLQEAISEYQQAIATSADSQSAVALAHAYSAIGRKAEAETILRDLERKAKVNSASPYTMATIYAGLGENDKAFELLERGYSEKSIESLEVSSLESGLVLNSLRPDARFQSLLDRMGLNGWTPRTATSLTW
jgi:TolB-like protein/DNA-binding winged helix-turn-helix (wHTH) protein/Tfp pilus assembly protein PilF